MSITLRAYEQHDFGALHRLDQSCFPPGIAYSRMTLHYFLSLPTANCVVAFDGKKIVGFILTEQNPPLGHTITLLTAGRVVQHGTFADLTERPANPFVTQFLTAQTLEAPGARPGG